MTCLSENNSIISNYFPKGWEISATAKAGEQGKGRSTFSLETLILATSTMNLLLHGQMTGLQEQEICTARCTPICESPSHWCIQPKCFQGLVLSALVSCFNSSYSSLSAPDFLPSCGTFATFAGLRLLTTGFSLIASFPQQGILSLGFKFTK